MSIKVYHGEPNGPSFTVLAALFETGVEASCEFIDLAAGKRHKLPCAGQPEVAMSIEGEGPVLLRNGEGMTDSVFIACALNEWGDKSIAPTDPYKRWEMMVWCRQTIERTAPAAALLGTKAFLADRLSQTSQTEFDAMIEPIRSLDLRQRWQDIRHRRFPEDQIKDSSAKIYAAVEKAADALSNQDWILGEFSIADLETYAWLGGMALIEPDAFSGKRNVADWMARLTARPAVKRALDLATTSDPRNYWAPGPEINRWG